jgi:hypothetical protein
MTTPRHYDHFCNVISHGPATGHRETIAMVMKLSGGSADPNVVSEWWNQWQSLRDALKAKAQKPDLGRLLGAIPAGPAPVPMMAKLPEDVNPWSMVDIHPLGDESCLREPWSIPQCGVLAFKTYSQRFLETPPESRDYVALEKFMISIGGKKIVPPASEACDPSAN